jgi:hypothetical protein
MNLTALMSGDNPLVGMQVFSRRYMAGIESAINKYASQQEKTVSDVALRAVDKAASKTARALDRSISSMDVNRQNAFPLAASPNGSLEERHRSSADDSEPRTSTAADGPVMSPSADGLRQRQCHFAGDTLVPSSHLPARRQSSLSTTGSTVTSDSLSTNPDGISPGSAAGSISLQNTNPGNSASCNNISQLVYDAAVAPPTADFDGEGEDMFDFGALAGGLSLPPPAPRWSDSNPADAAKSKAA